MPLIKYLLFLVFFSPLYSLYYEERELNSPPIDSYDQSNIYIITPPRTGSTLIFNIFQYLFENKQWGSNIGKVSKYHSLFEIESTDIIITTIRDPLSICASFKNIYRNTCSFDFFIEALIHLEELEKKCSHLILFKYEEFYNNNFDYIFNIIEAKLDIKISEDQKKYIFENFSTTALKKVQNKYNTFNEYDPITGIHGNHINNSDWKTVFTRKEAKYLYSCYYELRKLWGYPDLDIDEIYNKM